MEVLNLNEETELTNFFVAEQQVLDDAIKMFSNHPFSNVLYGRQVFIATEADKAGLKMPERFASYPGRKLESWQDPSWNYSSPADFKKKEDIERGLPPEWRR